MDRVKHTHSSFAKALRVAELKSLCSSATDFPPLASQTPSLSFRSGCCSHSHGSAAKGQAEQEAINGVLTSAWPSRYLRRSALPVLLARIWNVGNCRKFGNWHRRAWLYGCIAVGWIVEE
ncbi:uncharacterized protein [Physcomitrium patens]|uniref:uncharacterized protein n=1 Tax=Physcomitrium patens TaxID=3218 RepID=UPI00024B1A19|nr:uncharacterized protein LOC112292724 [Physcomitrium patens]XP_024397266.1 uncharacterized protein LOC112292724 [Physcomitrium patens]|eukprot:XP_024397265.1 uncharacterized protein LOC112292724 [Physcomitrella patens]